MERQLSTHFYMKKTTNEKLAKLRTALLVSLPADAADHAISTIDELIDQARKETADAMAGSLVFGNFGENDAYARGFNHACKMIRAKRDELTKRV
jgi:hypothetical protein